METGSEIRSTVKNLRYYAEQVDKLAKTQFDRDFDIGKLTGMNSEPGGARFDCLGRIGVVAHWIELYCDNIEANLKSAEELDGKLRPVPEESENIEEVETPEEFR